MPGPFQGMNMSRGWVLTPEGGYVQGVVIPSPLPIHGTWELLDMVGTHLSGMLSCFSHFNYGLLTQSLFLPRCLLFDTE